MDKPKKKSTWPLFVLLLLAVTAGIIAANAWQRYGLLRGVGNSVERLITPDGIIYDIHDMEMETLWLRKISPEGELRGIIPFSKQGLSEEMKRTIHIIAEADGIIYLCSYDQPMAAPIQRNGLILACDTRSGDVWALTQTVTVAEANNWLYFSKAVSDGKLYYGGMTDEDTFEIYSVDVANSETLLWKSVRLPFELIWFTVTDAGALLAMSPDSGIYRYEAGNWNRVYKTEAGMSAVRLSTVSGGKLYLFQTHHTDGDSLLRLDPGADAFITARDGLHGFHRLNMRNEGTWIALTKENDYHVSVDGAQRTISSLRIPFNLIWDRRSAISAALQCAFAVFILVFARHIVKNRRISLIVKVIAAAVPIFVIGAAVLITMTARETRRVMVANTRAALLYEAQMHAPQITAARFLAIDWDNPFESEYYHTLRRQTMQHSNVVKAYVADATTGVTERVIGVYMNHRLFRVEGGRVYTAVCGNFEINQDIGYYRTSTYRENLEILFGEGAPPVFSREYDKESEGMWLYLKYPIMLGDTLVAVLEVGTPEWNINRDISGTVNRMILTSLCVLAVMLSALIAFLAVKLRTLSKLGRGAAAISAGDYDVRVSSRSWDETGEIARAFNHMAQSVAGSMLEIRALCEGYSRFVPDEMLSILGKKSIRDVKAADCIETRAMFLLLTTESFNVHRSLLDELNFFYSRLLPVLSGRGVVERFNSREMRALLACGLDGAVETALDMLAALNRLNAELEAGGQKPVECSMLLARADSFLGVAGDEKRLNMMLFSRFSHKTDDIRAAGLRMGCRLMLEQEAYEGIRDAQKYRHRLLGYIMDNGMRRELYDFYDGDTAGTIRSKDASRELFGQAIGHYYSARYEPARAAFMEILRRRDDDPASREYLKESHVRLQSGLPPDGLFAVQEQESAI